jgi:hypothetical protein
LPGGSTKPKPSLQRKRKALEDDLGDSEPQLHIVSRTGGEDEAHAKPDNVDKAYPNPNDYKKAASADYGTGGLMRSHPIPIIWDKPNPIPMIKMRIRKLSVPILTRAKPMRTSTIPIILTRHCPILIILARS